MRKWNYIGTSTELQPFEIQGLDVWKHDWKTICDRAEVKDPLYGQDFSFAVFEISDGKNKVIFAAGEFSNGVWGFYQRDTN
jgi:hypothetical protein